MSVLVGLGPFIFQAASGLNHQRLRRVASARWQPQNRVGRAPALQFSGPGTEKVNLRGVIYPHYTGGLGQLEGMRMQCKLGLPHMFVSGLGFVFGLWVITRVSDTQEFFDASGSPRKVEFNIGLAAYGPDGLGILGALF